MKVPYTIPKTILRAYTRKLDEEALKKSYQGRLLVSEDPTWDKNLTPTLAQQCLNLVLDDFIFYHKLIEYFNDLSLQDYEQRKAKWETDLADYLEKRTQYEKRLADLESGEGIDYDDFDDDDPDHPKLDAKGKPIEPEKVEDDFAEYEPIPAILDHLRDEDRVHIVEELELDLVPLPLAIKIIPDEYYWERLARERWQVFDINDHNKSWRRLYMEKHAWYAIEKFHPADDDFDKLKEDLQLVCTEVIRLHIQNVIPICYGTPAKEPAVLTFEGDNEWGQDEEFDAGFGDDTMFQDPDDEGVAVSEETVKSLTSKKNKKKGSNKKDEPPKSTLESDYMVPADRRNPDMDRKDSSHIDFSLILPLFSNLKEMTIVYEMVETGLEWESRFFQFTDKDCLNLAKALAETPTIEKFELLRSHVNGEQCKTLVREGLIKMPHLKYLNLNYNRIGNVGARAVARLLIDENSRALNTIHTVRIARNRIRNVGGKALAFALTKNSHLATMDARLNSFGDPAGSDFGHALVKNTRLLALFLGGNKLTEESAYVFGKMLFHNKSLRELDVSSNDLGKKGGEYLALGMRNNRTILRLDVRLCNIGLDFVYDVGTHLRKNRNRISAFQSIVETDDYSPPEAESALLDLEEIPNDEHESDDEHAEAADVEAEEETKMEMEAEANEAETSVVDKTGEEEEEEETPVAEAEGSVVPNMSGTIMPTEKEAEKNVVVLGVGAQPLLTAQMLVAAGLLDLPQAEAYMRDPQIAAILTKAMIGPNPTGDGKKAKMEASNKQTKGKKVIAKEIKVVKGPQDLKRSNHALA